MKRFALFLAFAAAQLFMLQAAAQTQLTVIGEAVDACKGLQTAIVSGSTESLRSANKALKLCDPQPFNSLRHVGGEVISLDGHFVFDPVFVQSLIADRGVYKFAQRYADENATRGTSMGGRIFTKTCAVAKKSSIKYSFTSRGHQELAVITEPNGAVNVKIHDKTNDKWYRDTEDLAEGRSFRTFTFDLPENKISTLEIEITNVSKKDISFVIISN